MPHVVTAEWPQVSLQDPTLVYPDRPSITSESTRHLFISDECNVERKSEENVVIERLLAGRQAQAFCKTPRDNYDCKRSITNNVDLNRSVNWSYIELRITSITRSGENLYCSVSFYRSRNCYYNKQFLIWKPC